MRGRTRPPPPATRSTCAGIPGPGEPRAVLAYLGDFTSGYFAITNPRLRLGVGFRWPLDPFGQAWLWQEVMSGEGWPWYQRAYAVAVEPAGYDPRPRHARRPGPGPRGHPFRGRRWPARWSWRLCCSRFKADTAVAGIGEGGRVELA